MLRASLLLLLPSVAFGQVESNDFGGRDQFNVGTNAYKLNIYEVSEPRVLTRLEVWLGTNAGDEAVFVGYQLGSGDDWNLIYQSAVVALPDGDGLKSAPDLALPLEAGESYAFGVYLEGDPIRYYWGGQATDTVSWGTRTGAMWSNTGSTPNVVDPLRDDVSSFGYRQRLTVAVPADDDEDGYDATVDCDDANPDIHPGATETCDGQDDDCDGELGADEQIDSDGDGSPDCDDCDAQDPDVYPGAIEDPCGLVDMDCDGSPPDGTECSDPDRADKITGSRRCDTGGSPVGFGVLVALAAARRRRGPRAS